MDFQSSPSHSATSSPISIGWPSPKSPSSPVDSYSTSRNTSASSSGMTCAFPSWPNGPSLDRSSSSLAAFHASAPSAFISDADLFPDDLLDGVNGVPYLQEAPAPPRDVPFPSAVPLLPLYAPERPRKQRRRSSNKKRHSSKPLTPIAESPE